MFIKFKKIILVLLMLVLVGCGIQYDYDVDTISYKLNVGKTFEEKIIFTLDPNSSLLDDMIDDKNANESLEYQLFKTKNKIFPIYDDYNLKYKKKINKSSSKSEGILEFNYLESEYDYSNFIMNCFENYDLITHNDYFEARLSGDFYCWNNQNVEISVTTDYSVINTNGEQIGRKYMWNINEDNHEDVSIYYKVSRDYDNQIKKRNNNVIFSNIKYIIGIVVIILLSVALYRFYKKKKVELDI